ncbi:polysaccharide pyruvyl transferase family protein [Sphingobium sp. CAP-1]|uniref:polysaccharide pyruvyl transferase family protein n=1 Tax=Sphingobium sp. CAP-1 TaxID=2676077 RepID=UPI001E639F98|nr:polysaccharide pyruvyl transferase family protein [Sphingobium sp. CAP-1]
MSTSSEIDRLLRMNRDRLRVPLSWVATTPEQPYTNFGDGLSAVMVSSLAGMPVVRANFDEDRERIVAVGTIGHGQKNGILHFWGTGVDALRNPITGDAPYFKPPNTEFNVYATRGPKSAETFRKAGIDAPEVYGDPVWLLPRIWPLDEVEKTHDLGVILHISELTDQRPGVGPREEYPRYEIPEEWSKKVKIINTYCDATPEAMRAKVAEIVSCRRIVSTSLHGLVISETYGIPCAWFATYGQGDGEGAQLEIDDPESKIDHRIADFYSGIGRTTINAYLRDRKFRSDWNSIIRFIDRRWRPVEGYDGDALLRAFPLPLAVDPNAMRWNVDPAIWADIHF